MEYTDQLERRRPVRRTRRRTMSLDAISQVERLAVLADADPDRVALVVVAPQGEEVSLTRRQLHDRIAAAAAELARQGVGPKSLAVVALPNGVEHVVACHAAWWL